MTGTPRNVRNGSSPASRKYLNRGWAVASGTTTGLQLLGDETGKSFGDPHADLSDALRAQPLGGGQHQVRAIGLEEVDRADVGVEPLRESA